MCNMGRSILFLRAEAYFSEYAETGDMIEIFKDNRSFKKSTCQVELDSLDRLSYHFLFICRKYALLCNLVLSLWGGDVPSPTMHPCFVVLCLTYRMHRSPHRSLLCQALPPAATLWIRNLLHTVTSIVLTKKCHCNQSRYLNTILDGVKETKASTCHLLSSAQVMWLQLVSSTSNWRCALCMY